MYIYIYVHIHISIYIHLLNQFCYIVALLPSGKSAGNDWELESSIEGPSGARAAATYEAPSQATSNLITINSNRQ